MEEKLQKRDKIIILAQHSPSIAGPTITTYSPAKALQLTMLKFRRHLITNLKAIYRCQTARLWIFFSLLILLLVMLQVMEKLQPARNCQHELERALQRTMDRHQKQLSYALQTPSLLWEDDSLHWQREAVPDPTSTESAQDVFQMQLYFSQETPLESSPGSQEEHWTGQPVKSSKKVKAHLSSVRLKSQLPGLRKANREGPSPRLPGRISTVLGDADAVTSKFMIFANRMIAEEPRRTSPPGTMQVVVRSQYQLPAIGSPHHQWGNLLKRAVPNSAQPPQTEDFYKTDLARGFFPSWTEVSKVGEVTLGEGQKAVGLFSQGETCKPKTDIVFLKVHKSASSTVMNILFRFGEMHNLTFAFPTGGGNQLFYPHHFLAKFVQGFSPRSPRQFNILCHHMRFLQPEVQKVVSSSAVYFSILRNPVQLMESSFVYYKGASAFSRVHSLEEFLSQPHHYYNPTKTDSHYARNLMTFDFGFNPNGEVSAERVQLMIKAIEASFDLVLITEYFDESMVLLKEMLCWDLDSVVFFPLNSRDSSTKSPLPDTIAEKIKDWNRLDWEIYTHFNRTFWERIDKDIGRERMRREVKALRERQAELARVCLQGMGSVAPKDIKDSSLQPLQHGSAKILGYNLKQGLDKEMEHMCRRLVTPELQYSRALYEKQFPQKPPRTHPPTPSQHGNAMHQRLAGTQN
ncbi:galactose-3-O-sulfotransferase 2-like [Falco rusticolus]|uniref:galactose-3-O-sulfotransferase 2-like n=1 Tax=Falco rusticolus TaxID=120794 RepID=UPI0018868F96|nr:galactose-3-O-sulfotransferase 2-like [Falco rusticolus]